MLGSTGALGSGIGGLDEEAAFLDGQPAAASAASCRAGHFLNRSIIFLSILCNRLYFSSLSRIGTTACQHNSVIRQGW